MSVFVPSPPARAAAAFMQALRSAARIRFGEPGPAHRGPRMSDVRHLDDHMLKDIGYAREDRMAASSRAVRNRLMARSYG